MTATQLFYDSYLAHYGIKGQKWGRRRFQNKDMSLTPAGRKRYADDSRGIVSTRDKKETPNGWVPKKSEQQKRLENERGINPNHPKRVSAGDVARTVYKGAKAAQKVYNKLDEHGSRVLDKKSKRYEQRAAKEAARGHKLRSKYYQNKSDKFQDKKYDSVESFMAGVKDLQVKASAVATASVVGITLTKNIIQNLAEAANTKIGNEEIFNWTVERMKW